VDGTQVFSAIPDSGVSRLEFEEDLTDSWGENGGTDKTSAGYVTGKIGNFAKGFDGVDDLVPIGPISTFQNSFSIAHWLKSDVDASSEDRVLIGYNNGNFEKWFSHQLTDGNIEVQYDPGGSATNKERHTVGSLSTGTWYHLVSTYDSSNNTTNYYLDGANVGSFNVDQPHSSGNELTLGTHYDGRGKNYHDGSLDDLKIYDKVLTDTDVSDLYNNGSI